MNIELNAVRNELNRDDVEWDNAKITRLIASAKGSLTACIGIKADTIIPQNVSVQFEDITNTYIVEYCRALLFQADNSRILVALAVQAEALLRGKV